MADIAPYRRSPLSVNRFEHRRYLVRKKIFTFFGGAFHIYDPNGDVAFYSKQKAFKLKEDIRVYTGEDMTTEVLTIKARNIFDFGATFDVFEPGTGMKVGALRRQALKSILRDEWLILDANDRQIGKIQEDSLALALVRRFLLNLIPQSYTGEINGQTVCTFEQNFNPFVLKMTLDFGPDVGGLLDRRLGIAGAVLLTAIEGRQKQLD